MSSPKIATQLSAETIPHERIAFADLTTTALNLQQPLNVSTESTGKLASFLTSSKKTLISTVENAVPSRAAMKKSELFRGVKDSRQDFGGSMDENGRILRFTPSPVAGSTHARRASFSEGDRKQNASCLELETRSDMLDYRAELSSRRQQVSVSIDRIPSQRLACELREAKLGDELKNLDPEEIEAFLFDGDLSDPESCFSDTSSMLSSLDFSDDDQVDDSPKFKRRRYRPRQVVKEVAKPREPAIVFAPYVAPAEVPVPGAPNKKYVKAGLYAAPTADFDMELEDDRSVKRLRRCDIQLPFKPNRTRDPAIPLLPLPINYGAWYMEQERDFSLPFDVFYEYENHLLKYDRKPKNYVKIRSNVSVDRKKRVAAFQNSCDCRPMDGENCGEDCINRCMFYECNVRTCPCGEVCTNRAFQQRDGVKEIEVFYAGGSKGFGLKTQVPIAKNKLVIEYVGEIISKQMAEERAETIYKDSKCYYFLDYGHGEILDGGLKGNEARFVNHSCDPNCHIEKWHVDGEFCIGLFSSRDIPAGAELTYDYNFHNFSNSKASCRCGAVNCRGVLGKSTEIQLAAPSPPRSKKKNDKIIWNKGLDSTYGQGFAVHAVQSLKEVRSNVNTAFIKQHRQEIKATEYLLLRNFKKLAKANQSKLKPLAKVRMRVDSRYVAKHKLQIQKSSFLMMRHFVKLSAKTDLKRVLTKRSLDDIFLLSGSP